MSFRKKLIFPILLVALGLVLILGFSGFRYAVSAPSNDSAITSVTIKPGESVAQIGSDLERAGLIRNNLVFRVFVRLSGFETKLQAGTFNLPKNLSMKDLTYRIARGTTDQKITTLEGWRIEEVAEYLESKHILSKEEFLDAASNDRFSYDFLPQPSGNLDQPYRRLEGYLFPDTYDIAAQTSADDIIKRMLDNFGSRVDPKMRQAATKNGISLADTITLASVIEREAKTDTDRQLVAGILLKRLKTPGWKLESDVTVQFAVGRSGNWWPKNLTQDQLGTNSPYNTRKVDGLPPTPIDEPSLSSINAVINQQPSDYWFYLAGKDGQVHYAKTIDEHNQNIAKYL